MGLELRDSATNFGFQFKNMSKGTPCTSIDDRLYRYFHSGRSSTRLELRRVFFSETQLLGNVDK
jgi:hypothetical protein